MTAITAILIDSVRQLRAKKLFWIVLGISAIIFIAYGSIGFNATGFSIGYGLWDFENEMIREGTPYARLMLEGIFSSLIVPIWFTWGAIILALISTADVFPDFLAKGSIDLVVSKPVRRFTIFFTKYIGSLLFVFAQIGIFTLGVFLVLGLRLDEWRWPIFLAVPVVLAVFSYLYSVMVLLSLLTRSALASMLITFIVWILLFSLQTTEQTLNSIRIARTNDVLQAEEQLDRLNRMIPMAERANREDRAESWRRDAERIEAALAEDRESRDTWTRWHTGFRLAINVLPKPQETVGLLQRWLEEASGEDEADFEAVFLALTGDRIPDEDQQRINARAEFEALSEEEQIERADEYLQTSGSSAQPFGPENVDDIEADYRERSAAFVLGTSLGAELVILLIGAFYFSRRDF